MGSGGYTNTVDSSELGDSVAIGQASAPGGLVIGLCAARVGIGASHDADYCETSGKRADHPVGHDGR